MHINTHQIVIEENEEIIPYLYMVRRRWKVIQKFGRKYAKGNWHMSMAKKIKWKTKFELNKKNEKLGPMKLFIIYKKAIDDANNMLLEAGYNRERRKLEKYELIYERMELKEAYTTIAIENYRRELNNNMKKMKSSVKEIDEEIEVMDEYEEKVAKFQNRKMIKKQLEKRLLNISKKKRKEEKWKNCSSMITNLLFPRSYDPT
jgi:hypothetical protein